MYEPDGTHPTLGEPLQGARKVRFAAVAALHPVSPNEIMSMLVNVVKPFGIKEAICNQGFDSITLFEYIDRPY